MCPAVPDRWSLSVASNSSRRDLSADYRSGGEGVKTKRATLKGSPYVARESRSAKAFALRSRSALLAQIAGSRTEGFLRLHEVLHVPLQLELVVARLRRRRRRRLVRRDPHVPVVLEPRPRRDQPAHRHVFLQASQV